MKLSAINVRENVRSQLLNHQHCVQVLLRSMCQNVSTELVSERQQQACQQHGSITGVSRKEYNLGGGVSGEWEGCMG